MSLWPEGTERLAQEPPAVAPPGLHRFVMRWVGFFTTYLIVATGAMVMIGIVLLVLVLISRL